MEDCIFCKIVAGLESCFKIYEDDFCLAFLTPFPNTYGQAVVITKRHYSSYFADVPSIALNHLMNAAKNVALNLDAAYADVGRTAVVFEGWGVPHLHAKLYPMHGTDVPENRQRSSSKAFFQLYPGYVTTENKHEKMDDAELLKQQQLILSAKKG